MVIKSQLYCAFNSLEQVCIFQTGVFFRYKQQIFQIILGILVRGEKKHQKANGKSVFHWHFPWALTFPNLIKVLFLKSGPKMEAKMFPNKLKFFFNLIFYLMIKQRKCALLIQLDLRGLKSIFLLICSHFLATAPLWTSILSV